MSSGRSFGPVGAPIDGPGMPVGSEAGVPAGGSLAATPAPSGPAASSSGAVPGPPAPPDGVGNRTPFARPRLATVVITLGMALLVAVVVLLALRVGVQAVAVAAVLSVVPLAILLAWLRWIDRWEPEPRWALAFAFLWGAGIAVAISLLLNSWAVMALLSSGHTPTAASTVAATVVAPVVEETAKGLGLLVIFLRWRASFDGPVDGLVYSGMVATGFAVVEDVFYFAEAYAAPPGAGSPDVAVVFVLRALLSPFAHLMFTACIGLALGFAASRGPRAPWRRFAAVGWLGAVLLHSAWNTIASSSMFVAMYLLVLVPLWVAAFFVTRYVRLEQLHMVGQSLRSYHALGWISEADVQAVAHPGYRRQVSVWASQRGGPAGTAAMARFVRAATELAFARHRVESGRGHVAGPSDISMLEQDMLDARRHVRDVLGV